MEILTGTLWLLAGLVLLVVGGEGLVRGASSLAKRFRIPQIVIGLTIVAFGTSTPELSVNIIAASQNKPDIVFGNIIGSNIFNILFIMGVSALIRPVVVPRNTVWKEIPFLLMTAGVFLFLANDHWAGDDTNLLTRNDGIIMLVFFAIFLFYTFGLYKADASEEVNIPSRPIWMSLLFSAIGLAALFYGGQFAVDGAVTLARLIGLSEKFIAATIIAGGTSLPELATSAMAAIRGRHEIAVGNIVGSNIFNLLFVLPAATFVGNLPYHVSFNVDVGVLLAGSALMFFTMFMGRRNCLDRWEGALMLAGYCGYIWYLLR